MRAVLPTKEQEAGNIIKNSGLGQYKYLYYKYIEKFNQRPLTLSELVDGLLYIETEMKITRIYQK